MKLHGLIGLCLLFTSVSEIEANGFKSKQLKYKRVRKAYDQKFKAIDEYLNKKGLKSDSLQIFIRAFKSEEKLEIWGKNKNHDKYREIITYSFCSHSGMVGPKRKQGDGQIPEGVYHIDRFNPWSNFHLSLGLNYPNRSDRILGKKGKLGGDIFIHGDCVTIGCIPITNKLIKELYILTVEAKNNGQRRIPVHIFPFEMETNIMKGIEDDYLDLPKLWKFWKGLQPIYQFFEQNKKVPRVRVDGKGKYKIRLLKK